MKISQSGSTGPVVAIVTCLHGDEILGMQTLPFIKAHCQLIKIIANEEAIPNNRYLDSDANRICPGDANGNREEKLVAKLISLLSRADYVLDIHTTKGRTRPFTICTKNKDLARYSSLNTCVVMSESIANNKALIDHCNGISLEFHCDETKETIAKVVNQTIQNILNNNKRNPSFFKVYGVLKSCDFNGNNFELSCYEDEEFYPILFGEAQYKKITCMKARRVS